MCMVCKTSHGWVALARLCTLVHTIAHLCTLLHTLPHYCTPLHFLAHFCTLWHPFVHFPHTLAHILHSCTVLHTLAHSRTVHPLHTLVVYTIALLHTFAHSCTLLHTLAHACTLVHTKLANSRCKPNKKQLPYCPSRHRSCAPSILFQQLLYQLVCSETTVRTRAQHMSRNPTLRCIVGCYVLAHSLLVVSWQTGVLVPVVKIL